MHLPMGCSCGRNESECLRGKGAITYVELGIIVQGSVNGITNGKVNFDLEEIVLKTDESKRDFQQ